jgi:hypothetical protein
MPSMNIRLLRSYAGTRPRIFICMSYPNGLAGRAMSAGASTHRSDSGEAEITEKLSLLSN